MSHDPSHWDAEVRKYYQDIDLMLAGHTHGMQFGIEIPGFNGALCSMYTNNGRACTRKVPRNCMSTGAMVLSGILAVLVFCLRSRFLNSPE
ncbi:MAG: hypothetical protein WDO16_09490 [Bacteroidota bacterium]